MTYYFPAIIKKTAAGYNVRYVNCRTASVRVGHSTRRWMRHAKRA